MSNSTQTGLFCILPHEASNGRLYLGTQAAAQDAALLAQHGIERVVSVGTPAFHEGQFQYLQVPVLDLPSANLLQYFDDALQFIDAGVKSGRGVLVNCVFAQSRSAASEFRNKERCHSHSAPSAGAFVLSQNATVYDNVAKMYSGVGCTGYCAQHDQGTQSKLLPECGVSRGPCTYSREAQSNAPRRIGLLQQGYGHRI